MKNLWSLQNAKARFSELVRSLKSGDTGRALIEALQSSPYPEFEIAPNRAVMPVRDLIL
jgi:hypothetical protein